MSGLRMTALSAANAGGEKKHKVTVIGSGNWGSTICKIVAENTKEHPDLFEEAVQMWVYEEQVTFQDEQRNLTEIINTHHENVKYLPGIALPHNIVANPSLKDAVSNSSILIFNLPHQFIDGICKQLRGHILPYARGISCIKGVAVSEADVSLFSEWIGDGLGIYVGALSGANIASEIAAEKWSETTIAYDPPLIDHSRAPTPRATSPNPAIIATTATSTATSSSTTTPSTTTTLTTTSTTNNNNHDTTANTNTTPLSSIASPTIDLQHRDTRGRMSKTRLTPLPAEYPPLDHDLFTTLFHRPYFHVQLVSDVAGVSLGGALKNIVALAAGFVDGRGWGDNAKAAIMRIGLMEMVQFGKEFFAQTALASTFTETSSGVADLITSCSGGRNFRCARLAVERGVSVQEVEEKELNGQKLQGTTTAMEVNSFLRARGLEADYPLFKAVCDILRSEATVDDIPTLMKG